MTERDTFGGTEDLGDSLEDIRSEEESIENIRTYESSKNIKTDLENILVQFKKDNNPGNTSEHISKKIGKGLLGGGFFGNLAYSSFFLWDSIDGWGPKPEYDMETALYITAIGAGIGIVSAGLSKISNPKLRYKKESYLSLLDKIEKDYTEAIRKGTYEFRRGVSKKVFSALSEAKKRYWLKPNCVDKVTNYSEKIIEAIDDEIKEFNTQSEAYNLGKDLKNTIREKAKRVNLIKKDFYNSLDEADKIMRNPTDKKEKRLIEDYTKRFRYVL